MHKFFLPLLCGLCVLCGMPVARADVVVSSDSAKWGKISGALADQTDLQAVITAAASRALHLEVNQGLLWASQIAGQYGMYGGRVATFTTDLLAVKAGAYFDAGAYLYSSTTPGTVDLLDGLDPGRISASQEQSGNLDHYAIANDGGTTFWNFNGSSWWKAHLNSAVAVTSYTVQANSSQYGINAWTCQGSNNDSTWTTLDTQSGVSFNSHEKKTFTFANATAYEYYRFSGVTSTGGYGGVDEFEFFGANTANVTLTSGAIAVGFTPTQCLWMAEVNPVDTLTMGADVFADMSFDNSTWTTATPVDGGAIGTSTWHVYYVPIVPGGTPGPNVYWRLRSANTKALQVRSYIVPASQE
jgi:hypothetical protein